MTQTEIEQNVRGLSNEIISRRKVTELKRKDQKKFDNWIQQLGKILGQIADINQIVLPEIEKDLEHSFTDKNLFLTAMFRPSAKKLFTEIKKHFEDEQGFVLSSMDLDSLECCPDKANSLAWLGDTVIKYAILRDIWKPEIKTENLHNIRESIEK
jgi:hypothetical protein